MNVKSGFNRMYKNLRVKTGYNYQNKDSSFYKKQINKILICILIVLVILALKKIDIKLTNNVIRIVHNTLNYSINIKEDPVKAIQFVKDKLKFTNKITSVFNSDKKSEDQSDRYISPISGMIYQNFGEIEKSKDVKIFHSGVDILVDEKDVYSISDGLVVEIVQKDKVRQIKIEHGDIIAVYKNIEIITTKVGEKVSKGQVIGNMGDISDKPKYLHFEIWENDIPSDPLNYINITSDNTVPM